MMEISGMGRLDAPNEKPANALPPFRVMANFFLHHESLRAQFEWRIAMARFRGANLFIESTEAGRCFTAPVSRMFTQEVVTSFLSRLRSWTRNGIGVSHASSPDLYAFSHGCWRPPLQDTTPVPWRYFYVLGPRARAKPSVTLVPVSSFDEASIFSIRRTVSIELGYNTLMVYEADFVWSIEKARNGQEDLLSSSVFLTGHLW